MAFKALNIARLASTDARPDCARGDADSAFGATASQSATTSACDGVAAISSSAAAAVVIETVCPYRPLRLRS